MTLDLMDRFMLYLMEGFYEDLKKDLERHSGDLADAAKSRKPESIDLFLKMMRETQDILEEMEDENMEIKDFVHLLAEKYGLKLGVKNG